MLRRAPSRLPHLSGVLAVLFVVTMFVVFSVAFASCRVEVEKPIVVFGTAFDDQAGRTLLAWPADDAGNRFRFVLTREYERLRDAGTGVLTRDDGWVMPDVSSGFVARLLLVVPLDAPASLRRSASDLLAAFESWAPDAGIHRVFGSPAWAGVSSAREAALLLRGMAQRSRDERWQHTGFSGDLERVFEGAVRWLMPTVIAVVGNDGTRPYHVFPMQTVMGHLRRPDLGEPEDQLAPATFEAHVRDAMNRSREPAEDGVPMVAIQILLILPADANERAGAEATRMVGRLATYDRVTASLHRSEQALDAFVGVADAK